MKGSDSSSPRRLSSACASRKTRLCLHFRCANFSAANVASAAAMMPTATDAVCRQQQRSGQQEEEEEAVRSRSRCRSRSNQRRPGSAAVRAAAEVGDWLRSRAGSCRCRCPPRPSAATRRTGSCASNTQTQPTQRTGFSLYAQTNRLHRSLTITDGRAARARALTSPSTSAAPRRPGRTARSYCR